MEIVDYGMYINCWGLSTNGLTTKQFRMKRGLRQGNSFSPFLFLLVVETLHQMLRQVECLNQIKGISCFSFEISISHLQFTDDTIIFLEAKEDTVKYVKKILLCFELFSGLSVNCGKSCLYSIGVEEEISE